MDDKKFDDLKINMTILPEVHKWPAPDYTHWQRLHAVANEARSRVAKAFAALDEIDQDAKLTTAGKEHARAKVAEKALADFRRSATLERARGAVEYQLQRWNEKFSIDQVIKVAENIGEATIHAQVRERLAFMKKEDRLGFLEKHGGDPVLAAAVLSAPPFLSGLSDSELALIKHRIEKHLMPGEVAEAKAATEKALVEAERGWTRATELITQRGGLKSCRSSL
jgi:hypothetical protein